MTLCGLEVSYRFSGGKCCLHPQIALKSEKATSQKTVVSIYQARRSNIQKDSVLDSRSRENIISYGRICYVNYNTRGIHWQPREIGNEFRIQLLCVLPKYFTTIAGHSLTQTYILSISCSKTKRVRMFRAVAGKMLSFFTSILGTRWPKEKEYWSKDL